MMDQAPQVKAQPGFRAGKGKGTGRPRSAANRRRRGSQARPRALFSGLTRRLDEVADLAGAAARVEHLGIEAMTPGEVDPGGIGVERRELVRVACRLADVAAQALPHEDRGAAPEDHRELVEAEFRMVLHAPERAAVMADRRGLDRRDGVGGEHGAILRRRS